MNIKIGDIVYVQAQSKHTVLPESPLGEALRVINWSTAHGKVDSNWVVVRRPNDTKRLLVHIQYLTDKNPKSS